jgi:hypothetical protein
MATIPSDLLSLAGEYRVCSELIKRGVFVTMTYGNRKEVDVYAINDRQKSALKIEVKTSQTGRFVNKLFQKRLDIDPCAPNFWVLVLIQPCEDDTFKERFFVLTHTEICNAQKTLNSAYEEKYFQKHGKNSTPKPASMPSALKTSWFTRTSGLRSSESRRVDERRGPGLGRVGGARNQSYWGLSVCEWLVPLAGAERSSAVSGH